MATQVGWLVEGRVVFMKFEGNISAKEIGEVVQAAVELLDSSDEAIVHVVSNFSEADAIPLNIPELVNASSALLMKHRKLGWSCTTGMNESVTQKIVDFVIRIGRVQHRFLDNVEEAMVFLASLDDTLPDKVDEIVFTHQINGSVQEIA